MWKLWIFLHFVWNFAAVVWISAIIRFTAVAVFVRNEFSVGRLSLHPQVVWVDSSLDFYTLLSVKQWKEMNFHCIWLLYCCVNICKRNRDYRICKFPLFIYVMFTVKQQIEKRKGIQKQMLDTIGWLKIIILFISFN